MSSRRDFCSSSSKLAVSTCTDALAKYGRVRLAQRPSQAPTSAVMLAGTCTCLRTQAWAWSWAWAWARVCFLSLVKAHCTKHTFVKHLGTVRACFIPITLVSLYGLCVSITFRTERFLDRCRGLSLKGELPKCEGDPTECLPQQYWHGIS